MRIINGKESPQLLKEVILTPGVSYKFCRHCRCIKPPRAHHDSVSGKCVFEMDHYCPWMNNCVGYYNYRYFVLFLSYLFLGCCYIVIVTNSQVLKLNAIERLRDYVTLSLSLCHRNQLVHGAVTLEDIVLLTWTVGFSASLAVGILLGWHIFLIVTNQVLSFPFLSLLTHPYSADHHRVLHQLREPQ
jgi:palmitoyltransferase